MSAHDPLTAGLNLAEGLISRLFPDPGERDKARLAMLEMAQSGELSELAERTGVIRAEAGSESWLARSWRPLTMLTFTALIVLHWLGFTPENLPPEQVLSLLELVKLGLGGYVIGRSLEKTVKAIPAGLLKR